MESCCRQSSTDVRVVWLGTQFDNLTVREPDNGDIVGRQVCIDGTVWDNFCFDEYVVEYRPKDGVTWMWVDPLNPVYTATVINDPFARWDTVALAVPDGDYLVRVTAADDCGNTAEEIREVVVDNTAPTVEITSPAPCEYVEGAVEVYGTAFDANLRDWVLQYTGGDTSTWVTIASGSTSVAGGLLGTWNTAKLRPCAYTLRLVATDEAVLDCNSALRHRSEYTVSVSVGTCNWFDFDGDGDIDLDDFREFSRQFTGPNP